MKCNFCDEPLGPGAQNCPICAAPAPTMSAPASGAAEATPRPVTALPAIPSAPAALSPPPMPVVATPPASNQPGGLGGILSGITQFVTGGEMKVSLMRGHQVVSTVPLRDGQTLEIGRSDIDVAGMPIIPDLDVEAGDPGLVTSRRHCRLTLTNGQVTITDIGSANGTYVENHGKLPANQPVPVTPGCRAMLGQGGPVIRLER